ncbi:hypothetical protein BJ912DRAFT_1140790 [Pholiota molesta]|nr:hypothetical protein BJ912DRAFT_1140790 [Pholiota molesta]
MDPRPLKRNLDDAQSPSRKRQRPLQPPRQPAPLQIPLRMGDARPPAGATVVEPHAHGQAQTLAGPATWPWGRPYHQPASEGVARQMEPPPPPARYGVAGPSSDSGSAQGWKKTKKLRSERPLGTGQITSAHDGGVGTQMAPTTTTRIGSESRALPSSLPPAADGIMRFSVYAPNVSSYRGPSSSNDAPRTPSEDRIATVNLKDPLLMLWMAHNVSSVFFLYFDELIYAELDAEFQQQIHKAEAKQQEDKNS